MATLLDVRHDRSVLGLVGPVSVWMGWQVQAATSVTVWQHIQLSVQDTLCTALWCYSCLYKIHFAQCCDVTVVCTRYTLHGTVTLQLSVQDTLCTALWRYSCLYKIHFARHCDVTVVCTRYTLHSAVMLQLSVQDTLCTVLWCYSCLYKIHFAWRCGVTVVCTRYTLHGAVMLGNQETIAHVCMCDIMFCVTSPTVVCRLYCWGVTGDLFFFA